MSSRKKNAIACVALYVLCEKEERNLRKIWVKQWRVNRERFGHMPLLRELGENNPEDYRSYLRMDDKTSLVIIFNLVRPYITKKDTIMRTSEREVQKNVWLLLSIIQQLDDHQDRLHPLA